MGLLKVKLALTLLLSVLGFGRAVESALLSRNLLTPSTKSFNTYIQNLLLILLTCFSNIKFYFSFVTALKKQTLVL